MNFYRYLPTVVTPGLAHGCATVQLEPPELRRHASGGTATVTSLISDPAVIPTLRGYLRQRGREGGSVPPPPSHDYPPPAGSAIRYHRRHASG